MTSGSSQFGPSQVVLGLEKAARDADYRLSFVSLVETDAEAVRSAFDQLMENRPEAMIVVVPHETVSRIAQDLASDVPTVVLAGDLSRTPLTAGVDNAQGARLATRHLIDLGHTSVVHLAGPPGWTEAVARTDGWRSELHDAGLDVPPLRWGGDWSARSGYRAGLALAREKKLTAVFAANDQMALGLCAALREQGRRVPDDVSIVGFDDLPEAEFFSPPLTTVRQDFAELGRRAMVLVERVLAGEDDASVDLVPTTLVVRASTAPPALNPDSSSV